MSDIEKCPKCGRMMGVIISTSPPFYMCECGYDSRNYKIVANGNTTNPIEQEATP